jgi:hypothetical protein
MRSISKRAVSGCVCRILIAAVSGESTRGTSNPGAWVITAPPPCLIAGVYSWKLPSSGEQNVRGREPQIKPAGVLHARTSLTCPTCTPSRPLEDGYWQTRHHEPGYCSMVGVCGHRADGDGLNCPNNTQSFPPSQELAEQLQRICPSLWSQKGGASGRYCCTPEQVAKLGSDVRAGLRVGRILCLAHAAKHSMAAWAILCLPICAAA